MVTFRTSSLVLVAVFVAGARAPFAIAEGGPARPRAESRREALEHRALDLAESAADSLDAGDPDEALALLREARGLARRGGAADLVEELDDAIRAAARVRRSQSRFALEVTAGAGWDSNVPGTSPYQLAPSATKIDNASAAMATTGLLLAVRPLGNRARGLTISYQFSQTAYFSRALDEYASQEHALDLTGTLKLGRRLTVRAQANIFLVFTGLATFTPFQVGATPGLQLSLDEGRGFATELAYDHTLRRPLASGAGAADGGADRVSISQRWNRELLTLRLSYQFQQQRLDPEQMSWEAIFPAGTPPPFEGARYEIPRAYRSHQIGLRAALDLPRSFGLAATFVYENRGYDGASRLLDGDDIERFRKTRQDHLFSLRLAVQKDLFKGAMAELSYSFQANRSNVDNTNPASPLDYGNKNFHKHMIELTFTYDR